MGRGGFVLAISLAWGAGCQRPPPVAVEPVRFYAAPGLPGGLVSELAHGFAIASPTPVASPAEAEVAWLRDPTAALALGDRAAPDSAPEQPRAPGAFVDAKRRWAPVAGIATVIVGSSRRTERFVPVNLSQLADPRLRGAVAMVSLGRGDGPRLVAALELAYGERVTDGWLRQLAANAPILCEDAREVVAAVESGRARFGLVDSLSACAGGACDGLKLVFPDQKGGGTVVTPTALVVLPGAGAAARKLAAWLAGPDAEDVIVQRALGLLPLRDGATAPDGMVPTWKLTHLSLDWSAVAARERVWRGRLEGWPRHVPSDR